ncbi:MAG: GMC oxidoreductase [Oscillochloridaceae bacterium umkhey_bin13]
MRDERRIVVIGSGPAGAMAARTLVKQGLPVTMLEAGSVLPKGALVRIFGRNMGRKHAAYQTNPKPIFTSTGDPNTVWHYHLGPGGLSNQWTGAVPRFSEADFQDGVSLHECYQWPVVYNDLVNYYTEAEAVLIVTAGTHVTPTLPPTNMRYQRGLPGAWNTVAKVATQHGQLLTALPLADGPPFLVARRGTAFNSFTNLVTPLMRKPNFELRLGATALQLEWSGAQRRVQAVVYYDQQKQTHERINAAAVVVACGTLNSIRLLFNSTSSDFPQGLGNSEGLLGRYMHDHPREWWSFTTDRPLPPLSPAIYLTRKPYGTTAPLMATSWTLGATATLDKLRSLTPLKTYQVGVQMFGTMIPTLDQRVRPDPTYPDVYGMPGLNIQMQFTSDEIANMEAGRQHLLNLMEEAGFRCTLNPVVPQLFPGSAVHYGGGIRMHHSRRYGMLDGYNRLYDVPNVVVCDASCFPTSPEKNPTLTIMALAARAAEQLGRDL